MRLCIAVVMYGFVKNVGMAMAIWQQAIPKMVYVKIIGVRLSKNKIINLSISKAHFDLMKWAFLLMNEIS